MALQGAGFPLPAFTILVINAYLEDILRAMVWSQSGQREWPKINLRWICCNKENQNRVRSRYAKQCDWRFNNLQQFMKYIFLSRAKQNLLAWLFIFKCEHENERGNSSAAKKSTNNKSKSHARTTKYPDFACWPLATDWLMHYACTRVANSCRLSHCVSTSILFSRLAQNKCSFEI